MMADVSALDWPYPQLSWLISKPYRTCNFEFETSHSPWKRARVAREGASLEAYL